MAEGDGVFAFVECRVPYLFIQALLPAVEVVRRFIAGHLDTLAVQEKKAVPDAVCVAAAGCAEIGVTCLVRLECIEAQHDIAGFAVFVRDMHFYQPGPESDEAGLAVVAVGQRIGRDFLFMMKAKGCLGNCHVESPG